jgi:Glycosyl hydrolase family 26
MFFERSTGRRARLRTTLAVLGLVGSSLLASIPAQAWFDDAGTIVDPKDSTPTEKYVPKAGYTPGPRTPGRLTPATGALFGVHGDEVSSKQIQVTSPTGTVRNKTVPAESSDQGITKLEKDLDRKLDIDNHYTQDFSDWLKLKQAGKPVQLELQEQLDLQENRIPLVGWACGDSLEITAGHLDAAIDAAIEAFRAYPRDFFMRYCWEADGSRASKRDVVHHPEDFVAAWRYIWNRFHAAGVTNVIWVWTGNANGYKINDPYTGNKPPAPQYYPGDDYVDWVSADGYNWHGAPTHPGDRNRDFLEIYDEFMLWARSDDPATGHKASARPIMVAEYGTQEQGDGGADKALWFRRAHATVMPRTADAPASCKYCGAYSDIQAMVYFDVAGKSTDTEGGWTVRTTQPSFDAYKEAALNPWFNQIATLTWGPYTGGGSPDGGPGPTTSTTPPGSGQVNPPVTTPSGRKGYSMLGADGKVYAFGDAKHLGAPTPPAGISAADLEMTPSGNGYWIVDSAGTVSGYGDASVLGGIQAGQMAPGEQVTSLSSTPSGKGYWIFTNKGRAVRFGDATFFGDMSRVALNGPVLDSIPTPSGQGYYMVGSDGGIFAFGDAKFYGSMGATKLNAPVQSFDAPFKGSMGGTKLNRPVTGMVRYADGYLMVGEDGGIFNFSNQPFLGSLGAAPPAKPIVSVAALP